MINIFKGDSTIFANNNKFLTFNIETDLDLSGWKAIFKLGPITKLIEDISPKTFDIILTYIETTQLFLGETDGILRLIDNNGNIKTVSNTIKFNITDEVIENKPDIIDLEIPSSTQADIKITISDGTKDYEKLENIPSINDIKLIGNKTLDELGIQAKGGFITKVELDKKADKTELTNKLESSNLIQGSNIILSKDGNDIVISSTGTTSEPSGPNDYNLSLNKPRINGHELIGDKSFDTLGIQVKGDYITRDLFDLELTNILNEANAYTNTEVYRPEHTTMTVTAMIEGIGFKSSHTAKEIKTHADAGGAVILRFNAPDGSGEQSYPYETYKDYKAIFRRAFVDKVHHIVSRIIIKIDDNYNVVKEEEPIMVATTQDIQDLEDGKANYKIKVIGTDRVSQNDALEILTYYDQYDGMLIEFLTNGNLPNKSVATGRVFTDRHGDQYLITYNLDGTTTVWNKYNYEKHNVECRSHINETVDLDNFTIDVRGEAPYIASVQKAINKPGGTSDFGIIQVIAYNISNQIQLYRDMVNAKEYYRIVTGTADRHSFTTWNTMFDGIPIDTQMSDTSENLVQNKIIKKYIDDKIANLRKELGK